MKSTGQFSPDISPVEQGGLGKRVVIDMVISSDVEHQILIAIRNLLLKRLPETLIIERNAIDDLIISDPIGYFSVAPLEKTVRRRIISRICNQYYERRSGNNRNATWTVSVMQFVDDAFQSVVHHRGSP